MKNVISFAKPFTDYTMKEIEISQVKEISTKEMNDAFKNDMELIQNNILNILSVRNISQSELARAIESEPCHINYILRKKNKGITIRVLGRIAKALDVKLIDLVK